MELATTQEAAAILGITSRQVTRLARNGTLPFAHKSPTRTGVYMFELDDVQRLARERAA